MFKKIWLVIAALLSLAGSPIIFSGPVTAVLDGDTIEVMRAGQAQRVRLAGIDCPEKGQDFSAAAKQFTSRMVFGKAVRVSIVDRDEWKRAIAWVYLPDGRCLNHEIVRAGLGWWYRNFAPDELRLKGFEEEARAKHLGLWSRPAPVPPWSFRRGAR